MADNETSQNANQATHHCVVHECDREHVSPISEKVNIANINALETEMKQHASLNSRAGCITCKIQSSLSTVNANLQGSYRWRPEVVLFHDLGCFRNVGRAAFR
jgi:hypothetical protein